MFASRLWWMLRWLGHDAVAVLDGGFAAWQTAGLPVTVTCRTAARALRLRPQRRRSRPPPSTRPRSTPRIATGTLTLVDARAAGALSRRGRADRPGRRAHPGLAQPAVRRQPRRRRHASSRPRSLRAEFAALLAGRPLGQRRPPVRLGRHRLPQPAGDGDRRPVRHAAVPGLVERVVRRPGAAGRTGQLTRAHDDAPNLAGQAIPPDGGRLARDYTVPVDDCSPPASGQRSTTA